MAGAHSGIQVREGGPGEVRGLEDGSPPVGSRGKASVGSLGQKLKPFVYESMNFFVLFMREILCAQCILASQFCIRPNVCSIGEGGGSAPF